MVKPVYKRVLLKLSGEYLSGDHSFGFDAKALRKIVNEVSELIHLGIETAIVIGGGNLLRGAELAREGYDRVTSDQMGMLATVMNGLILRDSFIQANLPVAIMSSVAVQGVVDAFDCCKAKLALAEKKVVIFVAGTGNPLFSTDSAASLRGMEIKADVILKATKVDGIYSADPKKVADAKFFPHLNYAEIIENQLAVMDTAAIVLCQEHAMPIRVFNMNKPDILKKIVTGSYEGTLVNGEK